MQEHNEAYKAGIKDRAVGVTVIPYRLSDPLAMQWLKGFTGMQFKNQRESELKHELDTVKMKLDRIVAKNAMPADEFIKARLSVLTNELASYRSECERLNSNTKAQQAVIDNLSHKLSIEKKRHKRELNKVSK